METTTVSRQPPPEVAAAMAGDSRAFAVLYREHYPQIQRVIYRRMRNTLRADADDMISETFYRAMSRIETFTWTGKSFEAWLTTIAVRLVLDYHRSTTRREVPSSDSDALTTSIDSGPSPEEEAIRAVDTRRQASDVRRVLPDLTRRQRLCLYLRFQCQVSVAETAQCLDISVDAVKTLQHRAIRRARTLLDRLDSDQPAPPLPSSKECVPRP